MFILSIQMKIIFIWFYLKSSYSRYHLIYRVQSLLRGRNFVSFYGYILTLHLNKRSLVGFFPVYTARERERRKKRTAYDNDQKACYTVIANKLKRRFAFHFFFLAFFYLRAHSIPFFLCLKWIMDWTQERALSAQYMMGI